MEVILNKIIFLIFILISCGCASQNSYNADIVVYGDASGGVTAAIQAARMNKKVILISQYGHLGGMTSSGLGWTDLGSDKILGGLSREFYHRLYSHYQKDEAWTQEEYAKFHNKGQGDPALNHKTKLASTFEPKVAEDIFNEMIKEAGVKVIKGQLDLSKKAEMTGKRITAIILKGGVKITGKMFIDASYEGDLLEAANVSFTVGRESNDKYKEVGNGITGPRRGNQLPNGIDPYIVKGDKSSGLLPGVNADMGGPLGGTDHGLQAYCYRMVLTTVARNRVPITKPKNYNEADYEILFRAIEVGQRGRFFKTTSVPNKKTDGNNASGISCDLIGGNYGKDWNWTTLNQQERQKLAEKHRDWQLGMLWTLQNHPRVPEKIRQRILPWGLAKDEFTDNNNWPYNLYVREGRRMVSDLVMTESHCKNQTAVIDPIGMGAYTLDSHNVQRFVYNGMVKNEGDIQTHLHGKPYGISYRSIIPKKGECENLLVPWALSASHIAFGSIRMEPVFMALGQSAATAASMAIDKQQSVQQVSYEALRERLLKDDQRIKN